MPAKLARYGFLLGLAISAAVILGCEWEIFLPKDPVAGVLIFPGLYAGVFMYSIFVWIMPDNPGLLISVKVIGSLANGLCYSLILWGCGNIGKHLRAWLAGGQNDKQHDA